MPAEEMNTATIEKPSGRERRKHKRYYVGDKTLAFLGSAKNDSVTCRVVNISKSGIGLQYVQLGDMPNFPVTMALFSLDNKSYLPQITADLVTEVQFPPHPLFHEMHTKGLCIQFASLSREHQEQLDSFIALNALGEA